MNREKRLSRLKNVILYSRVGNNKNGTSSFDAQEDMMFKFAENNNLSVLDAVREVASGALDAYSRPLLLKALRDTQSLKHCTLLVLDVDRLSKSAGFILNLHDSGQIRFLSVKHGLRPDDLHISMAAVMAEENHRVKCVQSGSPVIRVSEEGRLSYAQETKPIIEGMLNYGMSMEEVVQNLTDIRMNAQEGSWTVEYVQNILKIG